MRKSLLRLSPVVVSVFLGAPGCLWAALPGQPQLPKPVPSTAAAASDQPVPAPQDARAEYLQFFEKVFSTMTENYYFPVTRENYDRFLKNFDAKIYPQLQTENKSNNFVKWRSAAYMVEALRDKEDVFTAFYPPQAANKYEQEALGKRYDLGIEGELTSTGYLVKRIEPRSDAFAKGLQAQDVIVKIADKVVASLSQKDIEELLTPLENTVVSLEYLAAATKETKRIEVLSREYFKQSVFMVPVAVPGVYCLAIQHFNQKTSEDMTRFMSYILQQGETSLIIDLRGNPGGPPLAAREISAFFLTPDEEFAYFQKKDKPKSELFVPRIPEPFRYKGDMVILVNEKSGSASELFSGILQNRGRAALMGTNTAGQVFLKSMFRFDDDSMLLLVTARGFHPDGKVFPFRGLDPDLRVPDPGGDLVNYAAYYLAKQRESRQTSDKKNKNSPAKE